MIGSKSNQQILSELNELVYGHRSAKIALINLVNRSKFRYYQEFMLDRELDECLEARNCLLIGESGTGKTHLMRSLAKVCDFPLICVDANQLAPTSASEGLSPLKLAALIKTKAKEALNENPGKYFSIDGVIRQTIVFIDEIDKLAKAFDTSGNWNRHVQAGFLTLIENSQDSPELRGVSFVFAGAFGSMQKYDTKENKQAIGFSADLSKEVHDKDFDVENEVVKYGLIPELVGRIHSICVLDKLEKSDYERILDTLILPRVQQDLEAMNITFSMSDAAKDEAVEKAMKSKMGVRSLHKSVTKLAEEQEFDFEWRTTKSLSYNSDEDIEEAYNEYLRATWDEEENNK